jgi:Tat-targeted selenate reductase subunit YnfE
VAYRDFREDPQANPLKTPSVKLKSTPAAGENRRHLGAGKDETISPLPVYASL